MCAESNRLLKAKELHFPSANKYEPIQPYLYISQHLGCRNRIGNVPMTWSVFFKYIPETDVGIFIDSETHTSKFVQDAESCLASFIRSLSPICT